MNKQFTTPRFVAIISLYAVIILVFLGRLLYFQVSGQDYYSMSTPSKTYTRTVVIQAQRGEIFDRNGVKLVANKYSYSVSLDYASEPKNNGELNEMILTVISSARIRGEEDKLIEPKYSMDIEVLSDGLSFSYPDGFFDTARGRRLTKLLGELNVDEAATPDEEARALMLYYGILAKEYNEETEEYEVFYNYPYSTAKQLFLIRLDMTLSDHSAIQPYTLAEDISIECITALTEKYSRGMIVTVDAEREYMYPGYASHILGRLGKISSSQIEYYTSLGYSLDAIVGQSGAEAAFEEYLRGQNGTMTITEDEYGNMISAEVTKEPVAGLDVYLTIDINMQIVAENALAENIFQIRENATEPLTGEDASAGGMTVLDVNTGELLAAASYPTFNLATFSEDFAALSQDENKPYLNRALSGQYAPGSTFKVGVAVAALTEGIIEKDTVIDTKGEYLYYASSGFRPRCWLYLKTQQTHGEISVVEAIQESCNYFFYDVGRQLTIEKMNEYGRYFGLGEPTGIELSEQTGILAGPEYRAENGLGQWSPGDTVQAAIGQSDNLFTPLQISSYIATILNSGVRYSCHILKEVREFGSEDAVISRTPSVASELEISDEILSTVKEGMKGVMDNGSAASVFAGYEISVGGKTGTAQVYTDKSENGIMTAFAPFDDPEIVITCVIEQGSGGTEAGYSVRDTFDYYFKIGKWAEESTEEIPSEGNDENE